MRLRLSGGVLICALVLLGAPPSQLARVKRLYVDYATGFIAPATDVAYGKRINGPRGTAALASVEQVKKRMVRDEVRTFGYGSGIEDVAYQNGMLLYALIDAHQATGEKAFETAARRTFRGLRKMSTLSPVEGFVPRGPHPDDGKTYYPDSSLDQHSLYLCGLWRYARSPLATAEEKAWIASMAAKILRRLEKHEWSFVVEDGTRPSQAGGSMLDMRGTTTALLFSMLAMAHDLTGDAHWKEAYDRFGADQGGKRWKALRTPPDPERMGRWNLFNNQDALRTETLRRIESSAERQAMLRQRLVRMADDMFSAPFFHAWRRSWMASEPWTPVDDAAANIYLKPLGVTVDSKATVTELFQRFDGSVVSPETLPGMNNRYEPVTLCPAAMTWQVAFLSAEPRHVKAAKEGVADMLARVKFQHVDLGWAYNYAMTASLWSLAAK